MNKSDISMISIGNMKLSKQVAIFNLPAGKPKVCIGMTEVCKKICYAIKPQKYSKQARNKRLSNLLKTREPYFVDLMVEEIKASGCVMVRIHEAGDFYEQAYLEKWFLIADRLPKVTFLAYTKSFKLDYARAPKNIRFYCSVDSSTTPDAWGDVCGLTGAYGWPFATTVLKGETKPKKTATCQPKDLAKHYCGDRCKICWIGKKPVYFGEH